VTFEGHSSVKDTSVKNSAYCITVQPISASSTYTRDHDQCDTTNYINVKKMWFKHELTANDTSKTAKISTVCI